MNPKTPENPHLKFRAHHFLCSLGFEGKGYSPEFIENFTETMKLLNHPENGHNQTIEVVFGLDSICQGCPNHDGRTCASEFKVNRLDAGHAETLGIKPGQVLTWGEAKRLVAERMTFEAFEQVCAPCAWRSMGACQRALERLKRS